MGSPPGSAAAWRRLPLTLYTGVGEQVARPLEVGLRATLLYEMARLGMPLPSPVPAPITPAP